MHSRARGEVIAALLVVALFCAIVGPVWWRRWRDGNLTTAPASTAPVSPSASEAVVRAGVLRVSDGDTLQVKLAGRPTTVRLLNVDTPEIHKPGVAAECLGPEARQALTKLLPRGSQVELLYDGPRTDRYGRTLAAVRLSDGRLAGAELARQGYTAAIVVRRADAWHAPVAKAQAEAMAAGRGLYDPAIGCTVAGRVTTRIDALKLPAERSHLLQEIPASQALRDELALPESKQPLAQRERYPAAWRQAQVDRLDAALAQARKAAA
ncbi:thermonuclease family protein [Luteococcus sp. H138]|uniref:thermonuclease family protein n=1 Tax=unclassified Luteococcus TaxID=2639923 RepID=UPI00313D3BD2